MTGAIISWADDRSTNLGVQVLAEGTRRLFVGDGVADFENFSGDAARLLSTRDLLTPAVIRPRLARRWRGRYETLVDTCGGDSFTDIYGIPRLKRIELVHRAARSAGMRVVMGPQTIGPFDSSEGVRIARRVLSQADLVFARDSASLDYIAEVAPSTNVHHSTDVVFALPYDTRPERQWDVLLNVSGLLWGENRHVDHVAYRRAVLALLRELVGAGHRVGVLAHVLENETDDNDVPAVASVVEQMSGAVEAVIPTSLAQARAEIAAAGAVVGSRMHACLNALSLGVPAFPWAYSRKFLPLMTDLGWSHGVDLRESGDPVPRTLEFISAADEFSDALAALRSEADGRLLATAARFRALDRTTS